MFLTSIDLALVNVVAKVADLLVRVPDQGALAIVLGPLLVHAPVVTWTAVTQLLVGALGALLVLGQEEVVGVGRGWWDDTSFLKRKLKHKFFSYCLTCGFDA